MKNKQTSQFFNIQLIIFHVKKRYWILTMMWHHIMNNCFKTFSTSDIVSQNNLFTIRCGNSFDRYVTYSILF